jgi:hypothetical protein
VIRFNDPGDGHQIAEAAGTSFNPAVDVCIARLRDGALMGGTAIHVASFMPHWINHDLLWVTFHYPFELLRVKKLFGPVPASNAQALEFDLKLGFKEEARIADVFHDGDLILLSMKREDCRWLKMKPRNLQRLGVG